MYRSLEFTLLLLCAYAPLCESYAVDLSKPKKKKAMRTRTLVESRRLWIPTLAMVVGFTAIARAEQDQSAPKLVIAGGGSLPDIVYQRFLEMAGDQPKLVVIPTASARDMAQSDVEELWRARGFHDVRVLHATDHDTAESSEFLTPLKAATAVWFGGGSQQRIADAYLNTAFEEELYRLVSRGVVVGGTSAGAAIQSRVMIAGGTHEPRISTGFDLLPHSIVDQHFLKRNRIPRLLAAIRSHPELIGLGIDEGTALIVQDGKAEVVGNSYVIRVCSIGEAIQLDAYGNGDPVPLLLKMSKSISTKRGAKHE